MVGPIYTLAARWWCSSAGDAYVMGLGGVTLSAPSLPLLLSKLENCAGGWLALVALSSMCPFMLRLSDWQIRRCAHSVWAIGLSSGGKFRSSSGRVAGGHDAARRPWPWIKKGPCWAPPVVPRSVPHGAPPQTAGAAPCAAQVLARSRRQKAPLTPPWRWTRARPLSSWGTWQAALWHA